MPPRVAISVENVSKAYQLSPDGSAGMKTPVLDGLSRLLPEALHRRPPVAEQGRSNPRNFFALRDISFEVRQGECIGIVGRNGAGKSTLLQIIAGTVQPTTGSVSVDGRVAALLELGSGFNPAFTGRENIVMNATVLGLSRRQIDERIEAIVAYADIGQFIDQPASIYSSGMQMRVAFAVAVHVDAQVVIVDEALGVGDARFQLKCARSIERLVEEGRTLLFVSHDLSSLNRLCNAACLLDGGRLLALHSPRTITNLYAKMMADERGAAAIEADLAQLPTTPFERGQRASAVAAPGVAQVEKRPEAAGAEEALRLETVRTELQAMGRELAELRQATVLTRDELVAGAPVADTGQEFTIGGETACIEAIDILDTEERPRRIFHTGDFMCVRARIHARREIPHPTFAVRIRNAKGVDIYGTNTFFLKTATPDLSADRRVVVHCRLRLNILAGPYFVSFGCSHFEGETLVVHHRRYDAVEIAVLQSDHNFGVANCQAEFTARVLAEAPSDPVLVA